MFTTKSRKINYLTGYSNRCSSHDITIAHEKITTGLCFDRENERQGYSKLRFDGYPGFFIKPLRSNCDQRQISLCNIHSFSAKGGMRIKDMITHHELRW